MTNRRDDNVNPIWIILAVAVVAALVLCFAPGMLLLSVISYAGNFKLDTGQMWTFSIIVSAIMFYGFYAKNGKQFKPALTKYGIMSLGIVAILALLGFGFKLKFPETFWNYFFG